MADMLRLRVAVGVKDGVRLDLSRRRLFTRLATSASR